MNFRQAVVILIGMWCLACQQSRQPVTTCTMSYSCNGNARCINDMHAYSGSGSFSSESDCLAWETGFLNSFGYPYDSVTACSCSTN